MRKSKNIKKESSRTGNSVKQLFQNFPFKKVTYLSLFLAIFNIVIVLILQNHLPPEVHLFYGLPEGEDQLTTSSGLIITGFFALVVIILNSTFAVVSKNEFIQKILILTGFAVAFMSLFTTIEIILLVGVF